MSGVQGQRGQADPKRDMMQGVRSLPARAHLTWRRKSYRNIGIMELPGKGRQHIILLSWQFPYPISRARAHIIDEKWSQEIGQPDK